MREFSTLKSLSKEELKNISNHKDSLDFKKGDVLFSEGNLLNGVYCIKEGVCKLTRLSTNGKEQIVRFVNGGDLLGYRSILSEEPVTFNCYGFNRYERLLYSEKGDIDSIKSNPSFPLDMMTLFVLIT